MTPDEAATARSTARSPEAQFLRFATVGAAGFVVDATLLTALMIGLGWSHYPARFLSFAAAATTTWILNRHRVFSPTDSAPREYAAYVTVQIVGACINLSVFVVIIESIQALERWPVIPLAGGAAVALVFNFFATRRWVFAPAHNSD